MPSDLTGDKRDNIINKIERGGEKTNRMALVSGPAFGSTHERDIIVANYDFNQKKMLAGQNACFQLGWPTRQDVLFNLVYFTNYMI